jgi:bacteriocin-type transport-associated protein
MRKVLFILGQLSDYDMEWLLTHGTKRRVPAGTTIIEEGKPVDTLAFVLDGRLRVSIAGLGNKDIAHLGTGEIVGEVSFVDSRPPTATVSAMDDSVLWMIPRRHLQEHLDGDPQFAAHFYRAVSVFLADRLRSTVGRLGYNAALDLDEDVEYEDELDPDVLDNVHLAGMRFDRMLKHLAAE